MDKWLRNNNVVKVIALVIGVLLWVVVHLDVQTPSNTPQTSTIRNQTISNVSIVAKYDQDQYYLSSLSPSEVTVVLSGKADAVKKVDTAKIRVELDLTQVKSGSYSLPVKVTGVPTTVTAEATPSFVRAELEEKKVKQVPVIVNVTGTPAEGYKAGQAVIKPNRVQVTVPESRFDALESAHGEISVDKANGTVTKQIKLVAYDKNGKPMEGTVNPQLVDVEVPVTSPFKTMPLQIKMTGRPAAGFSIAAVTKLDQITVFATQDILDKMDFYDGPQIDLTGLKEDKTMTVDVPLKKGIMKVDPAKVEVRLSVVPSATKTVEKLPITLFGQSEGYTAKLVSPDGAIVPSVTLEGAPALLDKLRPQDIQVLVDVTNLTAGRHELPISLSLPQYIMRSPQQQELKAIVEITANQASKPVNGSGGDGASTNPGSASPSGGSSTPGGSPTPSTSPSGSSTPAAPTQGPPLPSGSSATGKTDASDKPAGGDGKKTN